MHAPGLKECACLTSPGTSAPRRISMVPCGPVPPRTRRHAQEVPHKGTGRALTRRALTCRELTCKALTCKELTHKALTHRALSCKRPTVARTSLGSPSTPHLKAEVMLGLALKSPARSLSCGVKEGKRQGPGHAVPTEEALWLFACLASGRQKPILARWRSV